MVQPYPDMTVHHRLSSLLVAVVLCCVSVGTSEPEIRTPAGTFRGKVLTSHSGHEYQSYRGIPYALPPTGHRRFALPVRHPVIEEIRNTTEFGSVCFQNQDGKIIGQEDCLFINVYTPISHKERDKGDLKKVLVFLHGGAHVMGSSNRYLPGDLVTRGDIIVVTLNYRLNWFGFLRGNSSLLPGNMGHWDQLLALHWVRDNIRAFGGDPNDVTLSGESAGAMSSSVLSVSPLGKGLFAKGIMFSGCAPFVPDPPHTTNDFLQLAADKFGCGPGSVSDREDAVLTCLKQLPGEAFVMLFFQGPFAKLLADMDYLSAVGFFDRDNIVSITADDGYILVNSRFGQIKPPLLENGAKFFSALLSLPLNIMVRIVDEYVKLYGDEERALVAVGSDSLFLKTDLDFVEAFATGQNVGRVKPGTNAYLISFDHFPKFVPKQYMLHSLELAYLFDLEMKEFVEHFYNIVINDSFYAEDIQLKRSFIDLVIDFIKTGNAVQTLTERSNVVWHPFDSEKKNYLSFSLQPSAKEDIMRGRRFIWETMVPSLAARTTFTN
ncbi:unnamed protein product [Candidula unifasciata]|uniref:Carboxylic ester hydrolase n=1 Tax=Candidula unifasciata TaxID=100452 RepID=A0A8S3ZUT4_9EUPU|nr:unnamed protein product [Candidula unifasciata]